MKKIIIFIACVLGFTGGILLYSRYIGTSGLRVKEYRVDNVKITDTYHGFKIVHITDIHYGRTVKDKELKNMVDKINLLKPDIVVLTGDLIDKHTVLTPEMVDSISHILNDIKATSSKYAISGNHDHFFTNWATIVEGGGFINLDDKFDTVFCNSYDSLLVAGVSQSTYSTLSIQDKMIPVYDYLKGFNMGDSIDKDADVMAKKGPIYKILLLHEPDSISDIDVSLFDLILAGHSHNGQVKLPFVRPFFLPSGAVKYYKNYYKLGDADMYISSGIGTSNFNFRLFNRPSFNFYRLVNK